MTNIIYYYVLLTDPYIVHSTDAIDDLVTLLYEGKADFISDGQRIELNLPNNYFDQLRRDISLNDNRVPLYDIRSNHIFLIHWKNVYIRIFFENYRFVDEHFYSDLKKLPTPTGTDKENLRLLSYYDINALIVSESWRVTLHNDVLCIKNKASSARSANDEAFVVLNRCLGVCYGD